MATLVRGIVPAEAFALHDTLVEIPEVEIACERIVQGGENVILPLLWVRNTDFDEFESALERDPTIEDVERLSEFDDEALYLMQWIDRVRLLLNFLMNGEATILDAYGRIRTVEDCDVPTENRGWPSGHGERFSRPA